MQQEVKRANSDAISLKEIADVLWDNRGQILTAGVLGLAISMMYIMATPNSFEARWQMSMAQMILNNSNSIGISEEPAALIQRLRSSSSYPELVLVSCGKSSEENIGEYLDKSLQIQPVKNLVNVAEFKLRSENVTQAKLCADAIIEMVVEQQRNIIQERQAGRKEQLAQYQAALKEEMRQLERLKKSELGNFGYLASLGKLSWLRTRIDGLQEELFLSQKYPARVTAPLEISDKPVSPKTQLIMIFGLLAGLVSGFLYVIARESWRKAAAQG